MNSFVTIDPLLQVVIGNLAKEVVEYMMLVELTNGQEPEEIERLETNIKEKKDYIKKCKGNDKIYEMMNWCE